jgi:hypothetical protein
MDRRFFVSLHEPAIPDHVGTQDGGKPAFHILSPSIKRLAAKDGRI